MSGVKKTKQRLGIKAFSGRKDLSNNNRFIFVAVDLVEEGRHEDVDRKQLKRKLPKLNQTLSDREKEQLVTYTKNRVKIKTLPVQKFLLCFFFLLREGVGGSPCGDRKLTHDLRVLS